MNLAIRYLRETAEAAIDGWNRFWFTPADPATLGLIRILAGGMLFYTHLVWSRGLTDFFGQHAWVNPEAVATLRRGAGFWSYFWLIESPAALWCVHIAAVMVFAMLTLGLFTRAVSVLAFLITVSYVNRVPGSLFGLDQINGLLAMYLMVGPSGACYSLDRWLKGRAGGQAQPSMAANVAIRLIQVHMCVIYFFAGIAKIQGPTWWDGTAFWGAVANLEYQSMDLTWMAAWPRLINVLTHLTVFWEISYCALIWPRFTRPIVILLAIPLHLGIAFGMGMMTFGLVMLIGNVAFISPSLVRAMLDRSSPTGAGQGGKALESEVRELELVGTISDRPRTRGNRRGARAKQSR